MFEVFNARVICSIGATLTFDSPPAIVITCVFIEQAVQVSTRLLSLMIAKERKGRTH